MTMAFDDQTLSYTYIKQNYMTLKKTEETQWQKCESFDIENKFLNKLHIQIWLIFLELKH